MKIISPVGKFKFNKTDEIVYSKETLDKLEKVRYLYREDEHRSFSTQIAAVMFMRKIFPKEDIHVYLIINPGVTKQAELIRDCLEKDHGFPKNHVHMIDVKTIDENSFEPFLRKLDRELKKGDRVLFEISHGTKNIVPYYMSLMNNLSERKEIDLVDMIYFPVDTSHPNEKEGKAVSYLNLFFQEQWSKASSIFNATLHSGPILTLMKKMEAHKYDVTIDESLREVINILENIHNDMLAHRFNDFIENIQNFLSEYPKVDSGNFDLNNFMLYQSLENIDLSFSRFNGQSKLEIEKHIPEFLYEKDLVGEAIIFAYEKVMDRIVDQLRIHELKPDEVGKSESVNRYLRNQEVKKVLNKMDKDQSGKHNPNDKIADRIRRCVPDLQKYRDKFKELGELRNNIAHGYYHSNQDVAILLNRDDIGFRGYLNMVKEMYDVLDQMKCDL